MRFKKLNRKVLPIIPYIILLVLSLGIYYKLFLFNKIPFPGDLLVASYYPWLNSYKIPVQNPLISDAFSQSILWKYLSLEQLKSGQWPLWSPYSFMGTPLLANYQSAPLYPLNIFLLLPNFFGWGFFIYSQTLISLITFYLFVKQFVKSKLASILGSLIFSLGGLMTTWLELGSPVHSMAWLPLALYSVKKITEKFRFRFILILIISLLLITLAGHPQITLYSFILVSAYYLYLNWGNKKNFLLFFIIVTSIGLSAIQLLPSFDLLQKSIRQTENYISESNFGLLQIKDLLRFFIADYFGNPVTRNFWGTLNYFETSPFVGTLVLPLLIYSYIFIRKRENLFFLFLLPITSILLFDNPLSQAVYQTKIPLLTSSYGARIIFISTLSVAVLACLSIDHIVENKNLKYFIKTVVWSWAAILGILIGTIIILSITHLSDFIVALRNTLIPLFLISFFLLITIIIEKAKLISKYKTHLIFISMITLVLFDLGRYFLKFNPFVSNSLIFPQTPALEFLQRQQGLFRIGREHAEILPPNTWIFYKLSSYEGYDPIYLNQYGKFISFLNGGDLKNGSTSRYAEISKNYNSPYLDAANTKFFIAIPRDKKDGTRDTNYNLVFKDNSAEIFENQNSLPRVYFASSIIILNEHEIENLMMTNRSFDPRIMVALTDDLSVKNPTGTGSAIITTYSPNRVEIKTKTLQEEVLLLADQYDEGWRAKIDGMNTKISRANLIFRAVKIPAGTHEISFYYWPDSFKFGLWISFFSTVGLILLSIYSLRKKFF